MTLAELAEKLDLEAVAAQDHLNSEVTGGYASDLLSDVIGNAEAGNLWVTLQVHQNIVAVASMKDLAGIALVNGRRPDEETIQKAEAEGIPVLVSRLPAFELVGQLYRQGVCAAGVEDVE
jgi:hypothetical protein